MPSLQQFSGNKTYLSPRQKGNEGSRMRSLKNTLATVNPKAQVIILNSLQLTKEHLANEDRLIGIHILGKALHKVSGAHWNYQIIDEIGYCNGVQVMQKKLGPLLKKERNLRTAVIRLLEDLTFVQESNQVYKISRAGKPQHPF